MKKIIVTASALFMLTVFVKAQTDSAQTKPHHHPQWGNDRGKQEWKGRGLGSEGSQRQWPEIAGRWGQQEKGGKFGRPLQHPPIKMTEDQRNQAKAINESYEKQIAVLYGNDKLRLGEYKTKVGALRKERKDKLAAILTPEQRGKIEAFKNKREENQQVMAAARLERMKIELSLKDDQVTSIKAAEVTLREQMIALHEDETILPELKRGQMKSLIEKHKETVKAILTPQQLNILDSTRKQRMWRG